GTLLGAPGSWVTQLASPTIRFNPSPPWHISGRQDNFSVTPSAHGSRPGPARSVIRRFPDTPDVLARLLPCLVAYIPRPRPGVPLLLECCWRREGERSGRRRARGTPTRVGRLRRLPRSASRAVPARGV